MVSAEPARPRKTSRRVMVTAADGEVPAFRDAGIAASYVEAVDVRAGEIVIPPLQACYSSATPETTRHGRVLHLSFPGRSPRSDDRPGHLGIARKPR
jgi:hypothetical protein